MHSTARSFVAQVSFVICRYHLLAGGLPAKGRGDGAKKTKEANADFTRLFRGDAVAIRNRVSQILDVISAGLS
jgi:hypothetical protein